MLPSSPSPWLSNVSTTEVLITRATNPSLPEPNYALHLEVAEYINQKKANTPREAAMFIARIVNHRNPHIAMLALALLETLVQSCGYPFHLQISTKEFLNELVRRFPERPPPFPGPVMQRILDLINDWKEGICTESRWKDDLGNVRDMHRLLTFKGYRFRPLQRQSTAASASNLKTAEELENEDREAQSAKLQELIRRGTPRDLAAAQELMKSLAGANPDAKPDYRTQALTELNKLESKVILLNEILDNVDTSRGERFATGDVYDQVASILSNARPKIQGWISNAETDDSESLNTFLEINDQINTVLNRYESYKKGDYVAASNPIPAEYGGGASRAQNESLIDFDDSAPSNGAAAQGSSAAPIDDLASLFAPAPTNLPQSAPPISLGSGMGMGMDFGAGAGAGMGTMGVSAPKPTPSNGLGAGVTSPPHPNHATRPGTTSPQGTPYGSIRLGTPQGQTPPALGSRGGQTQRPQSQYGQQPPQSGQQQPPQYAQPQTQLFQQQPQIFSQAPQQPRQPQQFQQQAQQLQQFQQPPQLSPQQPRPASTATAPAQTQGKDPFADLVGLF